MLFSIVSFYIYFSEGVLLFDQGVLPESFLEHFGRASCWSSGTPLPQLQAATARQGCAIAVNRLYREQAAHKASHHEDSFPLSHVHVTKPGRFDAADASQFWIPRTPLART